MNTKIKLPITQVIDPSFKSGLQKVAQLHLGDFKIGWAIVQTMNDCRSAQASYNDTNDNILVKYGKPKRFIPPHKQCEYQKELLSGKTESELLESIGIPSGVWDIAPQHVESFNAEMKALNGIEVEIFLNKKIFIPKNVDKNHFTAQEIFCLLPIADFDMEEPAPSPEPAAKP